MLAGRTLSEDEIIGNGLRKCFAEGFPVLESEPKSASYKAMQILAKGLHTLPHRRYQSIEEIRLDMEEVIDRIDHRGVSAATLWESSRLAYKRSAVRKEDFLPRQFSFDGDEFQGRVGVMGKSARGPGKVTAGSPAGDKSGSTDQLWEALLSGTSILLEGPGGMGKTTLFGELWGKGVHTWSPRAQIVIYVSLKERQLQEDGPEYIRRTMIRGIGFRNDKEREKDSLRELDKLLDRKLGERPPIILLLDGLNEAGSPREKLLREIEMLAAKPGVGVLVSDRTGEVMGYALNSFIPVRLLPLEKAVVEKELSRCGCPLESDESVRELLELLSNPMMLNLYLQIFAMEKESHGFAEPAKRIQNADGLVSLFLEQLCSKQLRMDSGNQGLQLCHKYILHHLLPQIAWEMGKKGRTLLSFDEVYRIAAESFRRLKDQNFGKSFPEYFGKSRLMLADMENEAEWFDFAVAEQLVGSLGLLVRNGDGGYGLVHDNFLGYLSGEYVREGAAYGRQEKRKKTLRISALVLLAMLLICGVGLVIYREVSSETAGDTGQVSVSGDTYTEEEQKTIDRAVAVMQNNLGILSSQITAQQTVLEEAEKQGVLNGDAQDMESLKWWIEQEKKITDSLRTTQLDSEVMEELIAINPDFPVSSIQSICNKAVEMDVVMTQCLKELEAMLCDEGSIYTEYDEWKGIVEAYEKYLDAYVNCVYFEFNYVLIYLSPDNVAQILNDDKYTDIFIEYFKATGSARDDLGEAEASMDMAYTALKSAQDEMTANHYTIF